MNLEQIDTSTTEGKAEVMRLAAEGRRVAYRSGNKPWVENGNPAWNWVVGEYAIISEPVGPEEVWVVFGHRDEPIGTFIHESQANSCSSAWKSMRYIRADLAGEGK